MTPMAPPNLPAQEVFQWPVPVQIFRKPTSLTGSVSGVDGHRDRIQRAGDTATPNKGKERTPETRGIEGDEGENQKEIAVCTGREIDMGLAERLAGDGTLEGI